MFSKQSGNSGLYLFLVWIFQRESVTFGRGKQIYTSTQFWTGFSHTYGQNFQEKVIENKEMDLQKVGWKKYKIKSENLSDHPKSSMCFDYPMRAIKTRTWLETALEY